ncbi:MAG: bifunctional [glutamine synthetase] adenylyltransferase/[glutamine synthetase]-adenylyl-L-tyrosine phosphorylase [Pseudomonadota bacterium]
MAAALTARITEAPPLLAGAAALPADLPESLTQGAIGDLLRGAASNAPYLLGLIGRHGPWLEIVAGHAPEATLETQRASLRREGAAAPDARHLGTILRAAKSRAALLIALSDLGGIWPVETVTEALSALAEDCVATATDWLIREALARGKLPGFAPDSLPAATGYTVLAMGKLGAGELNFSSDIDLICLFDQDRFEPSDFAEAKQGFIRITRALVKAIGEPTEAGYVFRTDLRLRPAPSTTPVCLAMEAAERYYESLGRTWERAAHIKARAIAGDRAAGAAYLARLAPFVWRRHLDFAAIEDTSEMLRKIREKTGKFTPEGLAGHDLKLGPGGIRAIEFFAQTRQLIGGGRDPALRLRGTVAALEVLAERGWIDRETAVSLTEDYRAHRRLEHRLQMVEDAQTQTIPAAPEARARIAALCGTADRAAWERRLASRLARVHASTEAFFVPEGGAPEPATDITEAAIASLGFARPGDACRLVARWRSGRIAATRTARARRLYDVLEPRILTALSAGASPDEAIAQFDRFLSGLPAGVQVFSLFTANPHLLDLIVGICAAAPRLADHLGREPLALDALIEPDFFAPLPDVTALTADLETWLARETDYERMLDAARRWARESRFRAGVQVLQGMADAPEAGAAFSAIAEACLLGLLPRVIAEFATRHGPPPGNGLAVIALGKLGSHAMTSGSDLDLITVYDPGAAEQSEGPRPLPPASYYPRLTQALLAALTAPTAEGRLYEVDMRLRPSGRQGPVATSLSAFRSYQLEKAWVWEHLALTRARVVAGAPAVAEAVAPILAAALASRAGAPAVLEEATEMRARLLEAHRVERTRPWALKLGAGGLMEIEFLVQTGCLYHGLPGGRVAEALPSLVRAGWLTAPEAALLAEAHGLQERLQQIERVALDSPFDPETAGTGLCSTIAVALNAPDFPTLSQRLGDLQASAAAIAARRFVTAGD